MGWECNIWIYFWLLFRRRFSNLPKHSKGKLRAKLRQDRREGEEVKPY